MFSLQISVKLAALFSFVFAIVCLWFAVDAFKSRAVSAWCRGRSPTDKQETKKTDRA